MVVPVRVQGELADQLAGVAVDDADVQVVDEQGDCGAGQAGAEADVVEPAVVSQGDRAAGVDLVVPDPVVGESDWSGGDSFGRAVCAWVGVRQFSARWGRTVL